MTLPAGPTITLNDFRAEIGSSSAIDLSWIYSNTKSGQQSYSMSGYYSKAWYQRNADGNCNNGNCTNNCNCGNLNCVNCFITGAVNCANCDARAWFQSNCNCACTYNCSVCSQASYDCVSDCGFCGCSCFPAGVKVLMANYTWRSVDRLRAGEMVMGADGKPVRLREVGTPALGPRRMYAFQEDSALRWSSEHLLWTRSGERQWWWSKDPEQFRDEVRKGFFRGLKDNFSLWVHADVEYAHLDGFARRTLVDVTNQYPNGANTVLYHPITETGAPIIVEGYVAAGGIDEFSYDYTRLDWNITRLAVAGVADAV